MTAVISGRDDVLAAIAAGAAERERNSVDPHAEIRRLADAGLTAFTIGDGTRGSGASVVELIDFVIDLARADPIVAHILRAHFWFAEQVRRLPVGAERDRWVAEIQAGRIVGNANSERAGAAGARRFATQLRPIDGGWLLSGDKFYSTGTAFADWVSVSASIGGARQDRLARLVVPVDRPGVTVVDDWDGIGQHRTGTGSTTFTDVLVTADDVFEYVDLGTDRATASPSDGPLLQLFLQAVITGILLSVVDDAAELLRGRGRSFDHAPSDEPRHDPVLLRTVGELDSTAHVARAAVLDAAGRIEIAFAGARVGATDPELFRRASLAAARVKVHVDEVGLRAASSLFDLGGASAASRSRNLDRHWRNIRTLTLHNPTSYKAIAIGDHVVNGAPLPQNAYF
ncbi:acyl-CoA dehydrogenase family protein [Gordonia soli]|uniref:Dibenzothiophene monooxygenase n=1 Tax=Gordonia soli NBRC 108243 TaxID=1223545 RepID=M0QI85_9ACTN|nr:acyl-CoA dehydrogenase family protein [Gordonia soli]GAC67142.1 putative oxidoreductase [Gordonia soli NBRC 108243]